MLAVDASCLSELTLVGYYYNATSDRILTFTAEMEQGFLKCFHKCLLSVNKALNLWFLKTKYPLVL